MLVLFLYKKSVLGQTTVKEVLWQHLVKVLKLQKEQKALAERRKPAQKRLKPVQPKTRFQKQQTKPKVVVENVVASLDQQQKHLRAPQAQKAHDAN